MTKEKKIYLIFSKTGTWLSRSISAITGSSYTHVSLSFDSKFNNMYSFGRLNPNNPFSGGLTIESLYEGVYKNSPYCRCLIYEIPVREEQFNLLKLELDLYFQLNSDVKFKYNFLGLFAVLLDKPLKRKRHFFCSQFITTLLNTSRIWESPKVPELTRPTDLIHMDKKTILYEGLLQEFNSCDIELTQLAL